MKFIKIFQADKNIGVFSPTDFQHTTANDKIIHLTLKR